MSSYHATEPRLEVVDDPDVGLGVVAAMILTIKHDGVVTTIPLRSHGIWGIDDDGLVPGLLVPSDSWLMDTYGKDELNNLRSLIGLLTAHLTGDLVLD